MLLEAEYTGLESARSRLNILPFDQAVLLNEAKIMYKVVNVIAPQYIKDLFQLRTDTIPNNSLRSVSNNNFTIPMIWNAVPSAVKNAWTINDFKRKMINWVSDA